MRTLLSVLTFAACCHAAVIQFDDLSDSVSLLVDGLPVNGNGGRITNFNRAGEFISFDITTGGNAFITTAGFTTLAEPINDEDARFDSDRIVLTFMTGAATYHVAIGSDPDLPDIPANARDFTTIANQMLPPNPYNEDGSTFQRVATVFAVDGSPLDSYFIRSDTFVPEPGTFSLLVAGLGVLAFAYLRRRARSVSD